MKLNVSERVANLSASPIRELAPLASKAEKEGKTVYHLNLGEPDLPTVSAFMDGVRNPRILSLPYGPAQGMPQTLDAWQSYYAEQLIELATDEMCVTAGASEALSFAIKVTLDPGDELLLFEPFYPSYRGHAQLSNVQTVPVSTYAEDSFHLPDTEAIEKKISSRTRAILFSNPGNPTGVVYSKPELRRICDIAVKHELFVIADEIYREYVYEGKPTSVLALPRLREHAIVVDSVSKRLSACGARIGLIASRNKAVMAAVLKMAQTCLPPPRLGQYGLIAFQSDPEHRQAVDAIIRTFRARRDKAYNAIRSIHDVICRKPAGAFFMICKVPITDSADFARWLLLDFEREGETVMVAPMRGFYQTPRLGRDEVRIAYVLEEEKLLHAIGLLGDGLAEYREACSRTTRGVSS